MKRPRMPTETILILLFSIAAPVAIAVRQLHVPYTVVLVLTGLALGILNLFMPPHLTKELLFTVSGRACCLRPRFTSNSGLSG